MALEDKTEQATPEHRKEARKKGQVARSTDITSAFVLLAGIWVIKSAFPAMANQMSSTTCLLLGNLSSFHATFDETHRLFVQMLLVFFKVVGPLLGVAVLAAVAANLAQVGFLFSSQSLVPDLTRIDPLKGVARMFSGRSFVELVKSLLKVGLLGYVVYSYLGSQKEAILSIGTMERTEAGQIIQQILWGLCIRAAATLLVIAILDYVYQKFQFEKSIKMTKQEVKEEFKRSEGDPQIKAQFRRRHREMARKRMMQDVPKADVVVTNPTHLAVALRYDSKKMNAPIVVAKGQRLVAERIKEIARKSGVPIVENKPVARALFADVEIGHPVPVELYQAIAEILAFVYRLKRSGYSHVD